MGNEVTLKIQRQALRMLLDETVTFEQILKEHKVADLLRDTILVSYQDQGGSPTIYGVEIDFNSLDFSLTSLTGSFKVSYSIEFYFSCDAMTNSIDSEMTFSVRFDRKELTFTFTPPIEWKVDN